MSGKLTAVQWLVDQVDQYPPLLPTNIIQQALAMEREQIMESYSDGLGNGTSHYIGDEPDSILDEAKYYEDTYGKEAQP